VIRNILAPCSETKCVFFRIVRVFGTQVVGADGRLDRTQLGKLVFEDETKRRQLNRITHPWIIFYMMRDCFFHVLMGSPVIVLDVPLLFETKHLLWLVCVLCGTMFGDISLVIGYVRLRLSLRVNANNKWNDL